MGKKLLSTAKSRGLILVPKGDRRKRILYAASCEAHLGNYFINFRL